MSDPSASPAAGFDPAGRSVDVGRGVDWLAEGWQIFIKAPGVWFGISAVVLVAALLVGSVPLFGSIALAFLGPVVMGGLLAGCRAIAAGESLRFDHLGAGFRHARTGDLVMVGVASLVATALIVGLMFVVSGGAAVSAAMVGRGPGLVLGGLMLAALLGMALLVPLSMALWFAPPLVMFGGLAPTAALKASFMGCLKNILPFVVYGVILFVLASIATVTLMLGFLVLIPVTAGSVHAAYTDIYE